MLGAVLRNQLVLTLTLWLLPSPDSGEQRCEDFTFELNL